MAVTHWRKVGVNHWKLNVLKNHWNEKSYPINTTRGIRIISAKPQKGYFFITPYKNFNKKYFKTLYSAKKYAKQYMMRG